MTLKQFVTEKDVSYYADTIDSNILKQAESITGISFGKELKDYLHEYGYLTFEHIEFYGMNMRQKLESDMVKQTLYLHKYFSDTVGFVAIENQGDGDYFIVNSSDDVYEYDTSLKELQPTGLKLTDYMLKRFESITETA